MCCYYSNVRESGFSVPASPPSLFPCVLSSDWLTLTLSGKERSKQGTTAPLRGPLLNPLLDSKSISASGQGKDRERDP